MKTQFGKRRSGILYVSVHSDRFKMERSMELLGTLELELPNTILIVGDEMVSLLRMMLEDEVSETCSIANMVVVNVGLGVCE